MTEKQIIKELKDLTSKILDFSQIEGEVDVQVEKTEEQAVFKVNITSEEAGILIGAHGGTIESLQSFLSMAMKTKTSDWIRVSVDVSGWRAKHEEYLVTLAKQAADRAKATGEAQFLYNLNPAQRRVIHTALSEMGGVTSESEGEGKERCLVVKKM